MSDPAVTAQFLSRYFGDLEDDECFELRHIRRDPRDVKARFLREPDSAAAQAQGANDARYDCFFGAALRQRGKDDGSVAGVLRSRWLWADLDFKDFDGDPEAAKKVIRDLKPWPQILVQSGGGLHAYWQLAEPLGDPDDMKHYLTRLHLALPGSDGKVADAARVMRLPGTRNLKPEYDAPEVTASYFDQYKPYTLETLDGLLPEVPIVAHVSSAYDGPDTELRQLADALAYLNPDQPFLDYDDWTHILMGIHDAFPGPEGLALAEGWGHGKPGEIAQKWRTFRKGKYTVATVFYRAQQAGYVRPRPSPGPVITGPAAPRPIKAGGRPGGGVIWLPEFLADEPPPVEWCVAGLLPRGGTSLLVSPPKVGKSFFAINLGLAVAAGLPFLDRETAQGKAILFSLDMPKDPLWFPIARLAPAYGNPRDWGFLAKKDDEALQGTPFDRIAAIIREERPALAIIDTLQKALRLAETNNYAEVVSAMDRISDLAEETGTHILTIHHSNKGEGGGMNRILGSIGFNGAVDTLMMLQPDPEIAAYSLEIESRWSAPQAKAAYGVDDHDRRVFLIDDNRERAALKACGNQILGYLATCDKGACAEKDLRAALLHAGPVIHKALDELTHWHRVVRQEGKVKLPFRPGGVVRDDKQLELSGD